MTLLLDAPTSDEHDPMRRLRRERTDLEVIVPCLNEAARLPRTLRRTVEYLRQQPWSSSVVVVDNGSVDRTSSVVDEFLGSGVAVHRLGCSQPGKGSAVMRGVRTSSARWVGFMDADLATPIETLGAAVPLLRHGAAAVCASRYTEGSRFAAAQPPVRRLGSAAFRALAGKVVPDVSDTQCGFKFFDGDLLRRLAPGLQVNGFAFDLELLGAVVAEGHLVHEVPVVWSDVPGSTFSARTDGLRSMRDAMTLALRAARA